MTFDNTWIIPGTYYHTLPSTTVTNLYIYCYGGGGCGGFTTSKSGGGGGGGCSVYFNTSYIPGETLTITVGAGGISNIAYFTDGELSSVVDEDMGGSTLCLANGGKSVDRSETGGAGATTVGAVGNAATYSGGGGGSAGSSPPWSGGGGGGGGSTENGEGAALSEGGAGGSVGGGAGGDGIYNSTGQGQNGSLFGGGGGGSIDVQPTTDGTPGGFGGGGGVRIVYYSNTIYNRLANIITSFKPNGIAETHCLGDTYQGGYVFYIDGVNSCGQHGLIVCPNDIPDPTVFPPGYTFAWGCYGTLIGFTSTSIGTGYANTSRIIAGCHTTTIAAYVARYFAPATGWNGWYLPSLNELVEIYNRCDDNTLPLAFRTFFYSKTRWSSSEYDKDLAWRYDCGDATSHYVRKDLVYNVLPIRSF